MIVTAKDSKVEKISPSDVKGNKKLMKKIDQLPAKEQTKWIKTYVGAYNHAIEKEKLSVSKAEEYAARTAWDKVPAEMLEKPTKMHGPKKRGPLAASFIKEEFIKATEEVKKIASESSLPDSDLDKFFMWAEVAGIRFIAVEEEIIEFSPEEQEVLKNVSKAVITKEGEDCLIKLVADEENFVEIKISKEDSLEEEMEEASEEALEEGVE